MKTKIVSLILIIFLSSCSIGGNKSDKNPVKNEPTNVTDNIKENTQSWEENLGASGWLQESINTDEPTQTSTQEPIQWLNYNKVKDLKIDEKVEIKKWMVTSKNSIDNIVSTCDYLEGKSQFLINNWKKENQNGKKYIDLLKENLKEEKRLDELSDLEKLLSWDTQWKYKFIEAKNFDRTKFKNEKEFYSYFGFYLLSIKDEKDFNSYIDLYLKELSKEKEIQNENYVLPLISSYYEHKKSCKSFIEQNFISY